MSGRAMDPLLDFTGKIALVTGGSSGIGKAIVIGLAERGADVVIASRKLEKCEAVAEEVHALGRDALPVSAHCGRWEDCDRLVGTSYDHFGRIDILVNNAGMSPACPSHDMTEQLFDSVVNLNFKGPFRIASQVAHRMAQGEGGSIVNVSSTGAMMPLPGVVPYGASKAALNAMSLSLAHEYAPKVRVNVLSPGPFRTPATEGWGEDAWENIPGPRGIAAWPEEILSAALFLASPASANVTGTVVRCDGGQR